jgi:hypothetical protein
MPERFGFKARGLRDAWHQLLIFLNLFEKVSKEDSSLMRPSARFFDSTKGSGVLHMECDFSIAHHI